MIGYTPTPSYDEYLQHYGVKGMKWRKRKANSLTGKWAERNRTNPYKSFKDYNATGQNRDQQFREQLLEKKNAKSRLSALIGRKNNLKKQWNVKETYSTDERSRLRRSGYKDHNATSQNRDQQFREQSMTRKKKK